MSWAGVLRPSPVGHVRFPRAVRDGSFFFCIFFFFVLSEAFEESMPGSLDLLRDRRRLVDEDWLGRAVVVIIVRLHLSVGCQMINLILDSEPLIQQLTSVLGCHIPILIRTRTPPRPAPPPTPPPQRHPRCPPKVPQNTNLLAPQLMQRPANSQQSPDPRREISIDLANKQALGGDDAEQAQCGSDG